MCEGEGVEVADGLRCRLVRAALFLYVALFYRPLTRRVA